MNSAGSDAIATWPAARLAGALRAGDISSRELLDLYVDRIERLGGPINAVVTLDLERAYGAAQDADDARAAGDGLGPLHGLPVTIKDAIETEGIRSTGGALELAEHVPKADAPAVARLKDAGAIVFGKTNVPRWSADMQTFNEIFGTTSNPWDQARSPGGSSGGAAAAVACGFTSFELGTDIGGSVRMPAHYCGIYGLKPSFGVIPQRGYLDHVGGGTTDPDINVFGPLARSAEDLDLLLDVLAGPEPEHAIAWRLDLPEPDRAALSDYRIGCWFDDEACRVDTDSLALLTNAAERIADAGAKVEDARPAVDFHAQVALFMQMITAAICPSFDGATAELIGGSHRTWLDADQQRARLRATWAEWFDRFDALLCPVVCTPAFPHDHSADVASRTLSINGTTRPMLDAISWAGLIGVLGLPAVSAPIGRTRAGLPVGMQVVTPFLHDRRAVRLAQLAGEVVGGYEPPPGYGPPD